MKKGMVVVVAVVLVLCFVFGTLAPPSEAIAPKIVGCYDACIARHVYECCRYVLPQQPTYVYCEYQGYMCAF